MLLFRWILAFVPVFCFSFTQEGDELASFDLLIDQTTRQLNQQKVIRSLMESYKKQQEIFLASQNSKAEAEKLVGMASEILASLEENHYDHVVPLFYLQELRRFASLARKTTPSSP